jgi:hypothetical protein
LVLAPRLLCTGSGAVDLTSIAAAANKDPRVAATT